MSPFSGRGRKHAAFLHGLQRMHAPRGAAGDKLLKLTKFSAKTRKQAGKRRKILRPHQRRGLGKGKRAAFLQHMSHKLGTEVIMGTLFPDAHPAKKQAAHAVMIPAAHGEHLRDA